MYLFIYIYKERCGKHYGYFKQVGKHGLNLWNIL